MGVRKSLGPFREKDTTAWMQELGQRREQLPRMTGVPLRTEHPGVWAAINRPPTQSCTLDLEAGADGQPHCVHGCEIGFRVPGHACEESRPVVGKGKPPAMNPLIRDQTGFVKRIYGDAFPLRQGLAVDEVQVPLIRILPVIPHQ